MCFRLLTGFIAVVLIAAPARAATPVTVTLDLKSPGATIPEDFAGLSFETARLMPDAQGKRLFAADNTALVNLFQSLGIHSLRAGGNTADRATVPIPTSADIDALFGFARAANCKVIYTVRLKDSSPEKVAPIAKYLMDHYAPLISCIAIGNEPNMYAKEYPTYKQLIEQYSKAINAPDVAPDAVFCGPCTTPGKSAWARDFARDFGKSGKIKVISQHSYPGGSANKVSDPATGREQMLSPQWLGGYQKFYDSFAPAAIENGLQFRLEETNSFFNGGLKDASDTFASALWGLDYMSWWASQGAAGLNFHTGDQVAAGENMRPCRYAVFTSAPPSGFEVHPIGCAMKAFDMAGHGKIVPAKIDSEAAVNLTAYATESNDHLFVTLINKQHGSGAAGDATVTISPGAGFARGKQILLTAPGGDIAATSGVTLGGATIGPDGAWNGTWNDLPAPSDDGKFTVTLPAATAAIVDLQR